jgi:hypothetical protein
MCVNIQTSIFAFTVGIISGLILLMKSVDKRAIGYFVIFYSFVQFFEAVMYYNNKSSLPSRLILSNVGLHGVVVFASLCSTFIINSYYFLFSGLVAIYILIRAFSSNFQKSTVGQCIRWNFIDNPVKTVLYFMYGVMFYWLLFDEKKLIDPTQIIDPLFLTRATTLFIIIVIASRLIPPQKYRPGTWCLLSAITAPILIFI